MSEAWRRESIDSLSEAVHFSGWHLAIFYGGANLRVFSLPGQRHPEAGPLFLSAELGDSLQECVPCPFDLFSPHQSGRDLSLLERRRRAKFSPDLAASTDWRPSDDRDPRWRELHASAGAHIGSLVLIHQLKERRRIGQSWVPF